VTGPHFRKKFCDVKLLFFFDRGDITTPAQALARGAGGQELTWCALTPFASYAALSRSCRWASRCTVLRWCRWASVDLTRSSGAPAPLCCRGRVGGQVTAPCWIDADGQALTSRCQVVQQLRRAVEVELVGNALHRVEVVPVGKR
jgi:hypothetical protein